MSEPFSGIERRLERLSDCLSKLEPLTEKSRSDFRDDTYLRDIVERNLEVAAQAIIDMSNRIISIEQAPKPEDYRTAIERMGELDVIDSEFAESLAPLAGFRNVLVHEYTDLDWDLVFNHLQNLDALRRFESAIRAWLSERTD